MKLEFMDFEFSEAKKNGFSSMPTVINTNIDIAHVTLEKNILHVNFLYSATYMPNGSYLRIGGKASFSGSEVADTYEEWKKNRRISGSAGEQIVNVINYTASVNAVFIARVFDLAPPIVPPTIRFEIPKNTKIKK